MTLGQRYPRILLVVVLLCVVLGLVWGLSTSSVAFDPYNYDWDGGNEIQSHLGTEGTTVDVGLSTDVYDETPPSETAVVVVAPAKQYSDVGRTRLSSFVSQGGTLVVAAGNNDTNDLLAALDLTVRINGTPVRDEQYNYRTPGLVQANQVTDHGRVRNVTALTLNHGTVLEPGEATPLVNTSAVAYLDENPNQELDANESLGTRPVAVTESLGAGEVVVVSDGSVFLNAMLDRDGNRQFVRNIGADHDRVVIDYSHHEPLPPLTYLLLVVRKTPALQFLLGVAGLVVVASWGGLASRLRRFVADRRETTQTPVEVDEEMLARDLADRHPDWATERIERVTKVIIRQQQQVSDND